MPHVSQIFVYPVKSLRGFSRPRMAIDAQGIAGDRRFLVVDPQGGFLTQRVVPRMARIATALDSEALILSSAGAGSMAVPLRAESGAAICAVTIWQSSGLLAEDCGDPAAQWLSAALETPARLVRAGAAFRRPVPEPKLPSLLRASTHTVAFTDAYPFMVIGEATLAELNARLQAQGEAIVPIERFRPSFVVSGAEAFGEDRWRRFQVGGVNLFAGGPCARCVMTNTDPWTGERSLEPLRLLSSYRRDPLAPTKVNFGQNALHDGQAGSIAVGDPVTVLESEA